MTSTRTVALLLVLATFAARRPSPAVAEGDARAERVDALVHAAGIDDEGPGVAVCVRGKDGLLFAKGYGLADLKQVAKIARDTTFELASVSKQFAGAALLLLVERGKVALEDDVRKYLPEIPAYDPKHPITLADLSRHTSGLPEYFGFDDPKPEGRDYLTNADVVAAFAKQRAKFPLVSTPGEKYEYSNSGYVLIAAVVERVTGQSFGAFLKAEVFDPLGMKTAWANESPKVKTHPSAVGYTHGDDGWSPTWAAPTAERHEAVLTTGDGGLWMSLDDLAAWDAGLRAGKPVKVATWGAALAPWKSGDGETVAYAAGWHAAYGDDGEVRAIWHDGSWSGFQNYIAHDFGKGLTVIVLSNRGGFDPARLAGSVGAVFEEPPPK
jgi:CubicO group peptidase (beta-lactamase class C family)